MKIRIMLKGAVRRCWRMVVCGWLVCGAWGVSAAVEDDAGRQLAYVETRNTNAQCFDTGVDMTPTTRIVMDFEYRNLPASASQFQFCGLSHFQTGFMWGVHEGTFAFYSPNKGYLHSEVPADEMRHVFDIANGSQKLDDAEIAQNAYGSDGQTIGHIHLFAYLASAMNLNGYCSMRLYGCKIYEDGTLVRDYVPWTCRGVAGLKDLVSGDFQICFTAAQLMGPLEEPCAYVETEGTAFLDTGIVPTTQTKVELDCQYLDVTARQLQGYNGRSDTTDFGWGVDKGYFHTYELNGRNWIGARKADTDRHTFTFENGRQTIDGELYSDAKLGTRGDQVTDQMTLYLFGRQTAWSGVAPQECCQMRLYGCKIWEAGELVRDYRPYTRHGQVGLKEMVGGSFITLCDRDHRALFRSARGGLTGLVDCVYIETSGAEFIDTGVSPNAQTRMVLDFKYMTLPNAGSRYLTGMNSNDKRDFAWGIDRDGMFMSYLLSGTWQKGPAADTARHVWDLGPGAQKIDGVAFATQTASDKSGVGYSICLGCRQVFWGGADSLAFDGGHRARIYGCKFYEGETLTHDFVPCFWNGIVGLHDKVTRGFAPLQSTDLAAKRLSGIFAPYPDEELKYIESTGTQYIDMEVLAATGVKVALDCQYMDTTGRLFNGYDGSGSNWVADVVWGIDNGCFRTYDTTARKWLGSQKADTQRHLFTIENGRQTLDGNDYTVALTGGGTAVSSQSMYLFARHLSWNPRASNFCKMRVYGCQITMDGVLVRDFVPARVLGFPCLYDRVDARPFLARGDAFLYKTIPPAGVTIIFR